MTTDLPLDLPDRSPQPARDAGPPLPAAVRTVPDRGLGPRSGPPKRVLILGAGLARLVAAYELKRQGHEVVLLEAQNRVGGRVHTLRAFAPGLYVEAGAMRIPRAHGLTLAYCEEFGLPLRPFVMGNPNGLVHVGGRRMRLAEANADASRLHFDLAQEERGRTADELWEEAIGEFRAMVEAEGDAAWERIVRDYDQYSRHDRGRSRVDRVRTIVFVGPADRRSNPVVGPRVAPCAS